jgi:hypothetical protein
MGGATDVEAGVVNGAVVGLQQFHRKVDLQTENLASEARANLPRAGAGGGRSSAGLSENLPGHRGGILPIEVLFGPPSAGSKGGPEKLSNEDQSSALLEVVT